MSKKACRYVGADYETVDDGSAAHEPKNAELRPPVEHEGKPLHWVEWLAQDPEESRYQVWQWSLYPRACWNTYAGWELPFSAYMNDYRYLGPAEWNPVAADVAKRLDAGAGAYHALSVASARIAELEAEVALLKAAPAEAEPVDLAFPDNALKHSV